MCLTERPAFDRLCTQVLKPFCDNDKKYNRAIEHLLEIGLLSRAILRAYGGPNMLWGRLLDKMNQKISRFGGRLSVNKELTPEQVIAAPSRPDALDSTISLMGAAAARRWSCGWTPRRLALPRSW